MVGVSQGLFDLLRPLRQRQHQIRFRMFQKVRCFTGPVVRIDRHAAHPKSVQRQLMKDVLRPVLQQRGAAMTDAIAGGAIGGAQTFHFRGRLREGDLPSIAQVAAIRVHRNRDERTVGECRHRRREGRAKCGVIHDVVHRAFSPLT